MQCWLQLISVFLISCPEFFIYSFPSYVYKENIGMSIFKEKYKKLI